MSVNIYIENAVKRYGDLTIIPNLNLHIKDGEFFTLLGPSGCGKTTLLRMIAGFNSIEGGTFKFNDLVINDLEPAKRNIGMVFQNYAVFPHLTVEKNVAFGLKNRKVPKDEMQSRTDRFLGLMKIDQYRDRLPERLSGGQQQRVALARALVIEPDVLLMDEPLSNLDAKLRVDMRQAIREIQREIGITTVYVTHDQEEAMAISDRIAVMKDGVIQQIGSPKELYQRPANTFVANFIGHTNLLSAELQKEGSAYSLQVAGANFTLPRLADKAQIGKVQVSIRPEEFVILDNTTNDEATITARVNSAVFLGLNTHYFLTLADGTPVEIVQESAIDEIFAEGTELKLGLKLDKINIYSEDGEQSYSVSLGQGE